MEWVDKSWKMPAWTKTLPLLLVSAWNDSGGGLTHRLLDGHPGLAAWPFELQLGTSFRQDGYSGAIHAKYRWPWFPAETWPGEALFDAIMEDELKSVLRDPGSAKHRVFPVSVDMEAWRADFCGRLGAGPRDRAAVIQAYLCSFFSLWQGRQASGAEKMILGHCPCLVLDGDEILSDFPDARIVHVARRPLPGLADFRRRRPEMAVERYAARWNAVNGAAIHAARKWPGVRIVRFEQLLADREKTVRIILDHAGLPFSPITLKPTWNGIVLDEAQMGPFGGVPAIGWEHERAATASLAEADQHRLLELTAGVHQLLEDIAPAPAEAWS